jgi:hypothetical protein
VPYLHRDYFRGCYSDPLHAQFLLRLHFRLAWQEKSRMPKLQKRNDHSLIKSHAEKYNRQVFVKSPRFGDAKGVLRKKKGEKYYKSKIDK